ncbi:MAG: hypothetical protein ABI333_02625 [bacterium]
MGADQPVGVCSVCTGVSTQVFPWGEQRQLDMLFVIDNSMSMLEEQFLLRTQFPSLMSELDRLPGGRPDVHIGVTNTDLGTYPYGTDWCSDSDGGRLLVPAECGNPVEGATFIVDADPQGCSVQRQEDGSCTAQSCDVSHCAHEPNTRFVVTDQGCPRCRNFIHESLADTFSCVGNVGTEGCGFEQPLEAIALALSPSTTENEGFLRPRSVLAVIIISDEDDCSASSARLFSEDTEELGLFDSYRCFEYGVTCDVNDRTTEGVRSHCLPRGDPQALLHPVERYVDILLEHRPASRLVVAAITGRPERSEPGPGYDVSVEPSDDDSARLKPACTALSDGTTSTADPAVRLRYLVESIHPPEDLGWAFTSICEEDYSLALQGIGSRLRGLIEHQCLSEPLHGCADPGAAFGQPADTCAENDTCAPVCDVVAKSPGSGGPPVLTSLPRCLEVCADGPCLTNQDPLAAYAGGFPDPVDPDLPVPACWTIGHHPDCSAAKGAELLVSFREQPSPETEVTISCETIAGVEQDCEDGLDNDEDCLVDQDDPDCPEAL